MNPWHTRTHTCALALAAVALCLLAPPPGHAASSRQAQQADAPAARSPKKSRTTRIKPQQNHSGESSAERDRRLYRECQGLPNAGACLGYTRR